MAVLFGGRVYVFEFKVVEQAGEGAATAHATAEWSVTDRLDAKAINSSGVPSTRPAWATTVFSTTS